MKKNFKNVAFVLGMIAITSVSMTSCGEVAEKADAAGETVKEKAKAVAPEVTHDAIDTGVDNVVDMVEGDNVEVPAVVDSIAEVVTDMEVPATAEVEVPAVVAH
jgi:hydroxymethylpyrimidine/phosphomethylpyrimidine kinase